MSAPARDLGIDMDHMSAKELDLGKVAGVRSLDCFRVTGLPLGCLWHSQMSAEIQIYDDDIYHQASLRLFRPFQAALGPVISRGRQKAAERSELTWAPPGPPWDPLGLHLDPLSGPNLVHHMAPEPPYASGGGPVPQQWGPLGPPRAPLRPPWGSLWTHLLDLTWSITRPLRLPTPPLGPCP